jgi:hypothetical protein
MVGAQGDDARLLRHARSLEDLRLLAGPRR